MIALYVPTFSMCAASCGGPPLMANVYLLWSTVRQSSTRDLKLASISQFLTKFSTRFGRLPAAWLERFAVGCR